MSHLYTKQLLEYFDPDALGEDIKGSSQEVVLLEPAPFRAEITNVSLSNMGIDTCGYSGALHSVGTFPDRFIIALNRKTTTIKLFGSPFQSHHVLFLEPGHEVDAYTPADTEFAVLAVGPRFFKKSMQALLEPGTHPQFSGWRILSPTKKSLHTLTRILESVCYFGDNGALAHLAPVIEANLEQAVATAFADVWCSADPNGRHPRISKPFGLARRVRSYMLDRADERIQLGDICARFGISKRTLQYTFTKTYNTSPSQFLRTVRLNRVYQELLQADPQSTTVTDIAMASGFWHLGHFSTAYKRLFGEPPSHTLQRNSSPHHGIF